MPDEASLRGKVAIITGGASGMGLATAKRFLAEGAAVVVADFNRDNGEQFLREVDAAGWGDHAAFLRTDLASEADIEAVVALAVERFDQLDIIFNNAGIGGSADPVLGSLIDPWRWSRRARSSVRATGCS